MNNELIINGITYRKVEEPKEEKRNRLVFFIRSVGVYFYADLEVDKDRGRKYLCKTVEIMDNERILSREDIMKAFNMCISHPMFMTSTRFLKELGFDK
jgi:hypothetical protein